MLLDATIIGVGIAGVVTAVWAIIWVNRRLSLDALRDMAGVRRETRVIMIVSVRMMVSIVVWFVVSAPFEVIAQLLMAARD